MARMRMTLVAATATIAALAAPTTAAAANTSCDGLQQAFDSSTPNSTVTLVDDEVCVGHFNLPEHPITFEGGAGVATLSGGDETQILSGFNVGTTTIRNLTFIDGSASEDDGGAIELDGDSPAIIEGNEFFSNRADDGGSGGAVSLELDNQVLTARGAGAPVVLRGNTFGGANQGNFAEDSGGAVRISAFFRSIVVEDNTFTGNTVDDDDGGGLEIDGAQNVVLADNDFVGNVGGEDGGGAAVSTCTGEITNNVFDGNRLDNVEAGLDGAGLFLSGTRCNVDEVAVRGESPGDSVTQSDNLFIDNEIEGRFSTGRGAGEFIQGLAVLSTNDSFVSNTIAVTDTAGGGGVAYIGRTAQAFEARNLVAAGNEIVPGEQPTSRGAASVGEGGGLWLVGGESQFRIEDSTIEANSAGTGSGIAGPQLQQGGLTRGLSNATLVVANSIVFDNTGSSAEIEGFLDPDVRASDVCVGGAAHPDGDGAEPNSNRCVPPELAAPTGDGNVDQTAGSPTLDVGDNSLVDSDLLEDYDGDGRVLDANGDSTATVDMGADERPGVTPAPTPEEPVPPAAQPPAPQGAVQGQTQRSCKSKRVFRIRIRVPRGKKARSATVRVNNRKVKVVRGKRLRAPVTLRGLPRGRFTVRITVRLTNGKRITGKRIYNTCIPKLPGDGPPKV